jgi:hypothetical protein
LSRVTNAGRNLTRRLLRKPLGKHANFPLTCDGRLFSDEITVTQFVVRYLRIQPTQEDIDKS